MTETPPPLPDVSVAGLLIPAPLADRILTALRAVYPTLTEGRDEDDATVRAVLIYWSTSSLEAYEGDLIRAELEREVAEVTSKGRARAEEVRARVRASASRIRESHTVEEPPSRSPGSKK